MASSSSTLEKMGVTALEMDDISIENEGNENSSDIPDEFQREKFELDDPDMDPLEWSAKKVIPVPKVYYWETGNRDLPPKIKIWHHSINALKVALGFAEKAGGFFASILGIDKSRYHYVTSTMTEEQWEVARIHAKEKKLRRKEYLEQKKKEVV